MNFKTLDNCTKFTVKKKTVGSFYKENKLKPCLLKQLLNIFKLWCEWVLRENDWKSWTGINSRYPFLGRIHFVELSVKKMATVFRFRLRWFQECQWFNCLLYYIRHSLQVLEHCVLGGSPAIPPSLASVVDSLQCDMVPTDWLHPDSQPSPHILTSWLKGNDRWCSKSE